VLSKVLPLPGLDTTAVARLGGAWNDDGLWDDVEHLAASVFAKADDPDRMRWLWHHLVLAVGNFKRQRGRRLYAAPLGQRRAAHPRPPSLAVPVADGTLPLNCLRAETWVHLQHTLRGAGAATVATLLAALWPEEHVVIDWRVHAAANALRICADLPTTPAVDPTNTGGVAVTIDEYAVARVWIVEQGRQLGKAPNQVERALYRLSMSKTVPKLNRGETRTWADYATFICSAVNEGGLTPVASGQEDDSSDDEAEE